MTLETFLAEWHNSSPTLLVHTSGSTGQPKPMLAEKRRMEASARITCRFLGLQEGDSALLCMPLDYIAGKMVVVRSLTCGLQLISIPPSGHPLSDANTALLPQPFSLDFAAMVPLQVWNTLQVPEECQRLMQIRHLIIGGGAIDADMARRLKDFPNSVWSTYGMTETLSHIALRRLSGPQASDWYTPFEGVRLSLNDDGCLIIDAPAVHDGALVTNDRAELRTDSTFRILGRKDNVICSGGVKIQIEEVEHVLQGYLDIPFMITKAPDDKFGEQVVMLTEASDVDKILAICRQHLPQYWIPRRVVTVEQLPLTETGKPARHEAEQMARMLRTRDRSQALL